MEFAEPALTCISYVGETHGPEEGLTTMSVHMRGVQAMEDQ